MWAVKKLNCLGPSDIILQCDLEPSLIKWAQNVKSKRQEQTIIRSSPRRSHLARTSTDNGGSSARTHIAQTYAIANVLSVTQLRLFLISGSMMHGPSSMGGPYRRNRARTSSRSWKGIWKSRTEAGGQVELRCVAGQERPHGRTPCSNRRRSCVCSKCTTTCRAQLIRKPSISPRNSTEAEVDSNRRCSWSSNVSATKTTTRTRKKNENDNKNEKPTDMPQK